MILSKRDNEICCMVQTIVRPSLSPGSELPRLQGFQAQAPPADRIEAAFVDGDVVETINRIHGRFIRRLHAERRIG